MQPMSVAKDFARIAFQGMKYGKGDTPFFVHLEHVHRNATKYLNAYFVSHRERDAILSACWLHDLVEDTSYGIDSVRSNFGDLVAEIVEGVTDKSGNSREERHRNTYPLIADKPLAKFVKLCDRLANTEACKIGNQTLYEKYQSEYPYFRETLRREGEFDSMWKDLDELTQWNP